jgi:RTX calcium-binding nonapeptide repeat (4 copies)
MRRFLVPALLVAMGLTGIHAASGAIIRGTAGPDRLTGTFRADELYGLGGNDRLHGRAAADLIDGGSGRDQILGGTGPDRLTSSGDLRADSIRCGAGSDIVTADLRDRIAADCETVTRQLSRDTGALRGGEGQHETQVEPDSFAHGSTIVTVFQSGRYVSGGAESNGFATSLNGGRTWRSGLLPGLTGRFSGVSDPVVAYDAAHRWWLAASLVRTFDELGIVVNRSRDGVVWGRPITAALSATEEYDKEWIVCDGWSSSRFRGRCYLSYMNFARNTMETRRSTDGGRTWSAPVSLDARRAAGVVNGIQNVVRPNGDVLLIFSVFGAAIGDDEIAATRSTDGGVTFGSPMRVAPLHNAEFGWLRAPPFVSADVEAGGRVYVAWRDCIVGSFCTADIVLASSPDGVRWTEPARIPSVSPEEFSFMPAVAVDPATSGRNTRLAVLYHSLNPSPICTPECIEIDVKLTVSRNNGQTWTQPVRLNSVSMQPYWMADTSQGRMLADYVSVSWVGGRPIPVFSLALPPTGPVFRQSIFATTRFR